MQEFCFCRASRMVLTSVIATAGAVGADSAGFGVRRGGASSERLRSFLVCGETRKQKVERSERELEETTLLLWEQTRKLHVQNLGHNHQPERETASRNTSVGLGPRERHDPSLALAVAQQMDQHGPTVQERFAGRLHQREDDQTGSGCTLRRLPDAFCSESPGVAHCTGDARKDTETTLQARELREERETEEREETRLGLAGRDKEEAKRREERVEARRGEEREEAKRREERAEAGRREEGEEAKRREEEL
eukprot:180258-Rhodomonas_salina.1